MSYLLDKILAMFGPSRQGDELSSIPEEKYQKYQNFINRTGADISSNFSVVLTKVGRNKLKVITAINELTHLSIQESKRLTDEIPSIIKANITLEEAKLYQLKFESLGATINIVQ